ncbi:MAG TPA: hypothetical protein VGG29_17690 [Caulobacteraceae bacterium]|jgi:hypothetical protein
MTLEEEAERLAELLVGKTVTRVFRHRPNEVALEFEDGARFFADCLGDKKSMELSVT